jgi:HEPN domain-containing protein
MKPLEDQEVSAWIAKATEDWRVASILLAQPDPIHDAVAFHCQQAAEKLLKAVLVARAENPPRTHDLEALFDLVAPGREPSTELADALGYLTAFAVMPRYPITEGLRAADRGQRAMDALEAVTDWLAAEIGWRICGRFV